MTTYIFMLIEKENRNLETLYTCVGTKTDFLCFSCYALDSLQEKYNYYYISC